MRWWNSRTASAVQLLGLVGLAVLASGDVDRTMRANDKPVTAVQTRELAHEVEVAKWFGK
eukprot:scaffold16871_cov118-Isochrysis_galbana.AAC.1